jgi:hypothetical protein
MDHKRADIDYLYWMDQEQTQLFKLSGTLAQNMEEREVVTSVSAPTSTNPPKGTQSFTIGYICFLFIDFKYM